MVFDIFSHNGHLGHVLFLNIMIIYMYIASGQGQPTPGPEIFSSASIFFSFAHS